MGIAHKAQIKNGTEAQEKVKYVQKLYARREIDFQQANSVVQSYLGILSHCDSYRLKYKIFGDFVLKWHDNDDDFLGDGGEQT